MSIESYWMGKEAALEDLADFIDSGAISSDCYRAIDESLSAPMNKYASEEDVSYRVGVEEVLYDFLKTAASYWGTHDVYDEQEAVLDIFEKVAQSQPLTKEQIEARKNEYGAEKRSKAQANIKAKNSALAQLSDAGLEAYQKDSGYDGPSRMQRLRESGAAAGDMIMRNKGKSALALGALTATGLGARHLLKKRKEKQRQLEGQQKAASYHYNEDDIDTAIAILADAGYDFE